MRRNLNCAERNLLAILGFLKGKKIRKKLEKIRKLEKNVCKQCL